MPAVQRVYRILSQGCFERLEPDIGKLICPVLRGGVVGNAGPLLDTMRLTTLTQTAKGLPAATSLEGRTLRDDVVRLRRESSMEECRKTSGIQVLDKPLELSAIGHSME